MAKLRMLGAIAVAAMLTACSGGGASAGGSAGGSNVLDACALLDKSVVAKTLGRPVQSTELSAVHDGSEGSERFSQCTYKFGELDMLVFASGQSSDSVADLTTRFRDQMQIAKAPTADVAGVGKAALWNEDLHALWVFPGNDRYYGFTLYKVGQPDQKAAAVALAREFGL